MSRGNSSQDSRDVTDSPTGHTGPSALRETSMDRDSTMQDGAQSAKRKRGVARESSCMDTQKRKNSPKRKRRSGRKKQRVEEGLSDRGDDHLPSERQTRGTQPDTSSSSAHSDDGRDNTDSDIGWDGEQWEAIGRKIQEAVESDTNVNQLQDVFRHFILALLQPPRVRESTILRVMRRGGVHLRVATMCSGTDAPIFALHELQESIASLGLPSLFSFEHVFSAEIEPFKQAFIRRNVAPQGPIFRDIVEMAKGRASMTADGSYGYVDDYHHLDLLVLGASCVDFSNLKTHIMTSFTPRTMDRCDGGGGSSFTQGPTSEFREFLSEVAAESTKESAITFFAGLQYIVRHRPKIVLLENVIHAPWTQAETFWFPQCGYTARYEKVNSKEYGIPQIRQRGYLVAVDNRLAGEGGAGHAQSMVSAWSTILGGLKVEKHIPLRAFLLERRHPIVVNARAMTRRPWAKASDARMCQLKHTEARKVEGLPADNVYTCLDRQGRSQPRDEMWVEWVRSQGFRIQDLLEIHYQRCLKKGFDMAYKTQVYDLSQNVDRTPGQLGVTPCLTPKGNPFVTDQGRPLLGLEALALQGIDVVKLSLSTETSAQLQDLAGNAMTSTVVGAAILSALIATESIHKAMDRAQPYSVSYRKQLTLTPSATMTHPVSQEVGAAMQLILTTERSFLGRPLREVLRAFRRCRSYCPCDGNQAYDRGQNLLQCTLCLQIRCRHCAGNPKHDFRPYHWGPHVESPSLPFFQQQQQQQQQSAESLYPVAEAENHMMSFAVPFFDVSDTLPVNREMTRKNWTTIGFPPIGSVVDGLGGDDEYRRVLGGFLQREVYRKRFYFVRVEIGAAITYVYRTVNAIIHIALRDHMAQWIVFVDSTSTASDSHAFHNDERYRMLVGDHALPVLRGTAHDPNLPIIPAIVDWEVLLPTPQSFALQVEHLPEGQVRLSWPERPPFDEFQHLQRQYYASAVLDKIMGVYTVSRVCGTSLNHLWLHQQSGVFLFHEAGRVSLPADDAWVIGTECRRLQPHEYRNTLVRFPPAFDPTSPSVLDSIEVSIPYAWSTVKLVDNTHSLFPFTQAACPEIFVEPYFFQQSSLSSNHRSGWQSTGCSTARPLMELIVPVQDVTWPSKTFPTLWDSQSETFAACSRQDGDLEEWLPVLQQQRERALEVVSFLAKTVGRAELETILGTMEAKSHFLVQQNGEPQQQQQQQICSDCVPPIPQTLRIINQVGRVSRVFTSPRECHAYEAAIQKRPSPLQVLVRLERGRLHVRVCWNMEALVHRAAGYLPPNTNFMGIPRRDGSSSDTTRYEASIKIEPQYVQPSFFKLKSFYASLRPTEITGSVHAFLAACGQPPSFIRNQRSLRLDQVAAVCWMLSERFLDPRPFMEAEEEEFVSRSLAMRASAQVQRPNYQRGGILAHDVGYGKTVVTLAFIDYLRSHRDLETNHDMFKTKGGVLIIVPAHLVNQWIGEIKHFLRNDRDAWTIGVVRERKNLPTKAVQEADIVIASFKAFHFHQDTLDLLATASASPRISERETTAEVDPWYRRAVQRMRLLHQAFLKAKDKAEGEKWAQQSAQAYLDKIQTASEKYIPPSSRRHNKVSHKSIDPNLSQPIFSSSTSTISAQRRKNAASQQKDTPDGEVDFAAFQWQKGNNQKSVSNIMLHGALLEQFSFDTIFYDEFSYEEESVARYVKNAHAKAKFILSGTPSMSNLQLVCDMASLLNVHVARAEPSVPLHLPGITVGSPSANMTPEEKYRAYHSLKSSSFVLGRYQKGRDFVDHFIRRNPSILGHYQVTERVIICPLDPVTSVMYNILMQSLYDAKWIMDDLPQTLRMLLVPCQSEPQLSDTEGNAKVAYTYRSHVRQTIHALLLTASCHPQDFARVFTNQPRPPIRGLSVLEPLIGYMDREVGSLEIYLKCQFDRLMYLWDRAACDPTEGNENHRKKRTSFVGLVEDLWRELFVQDAQADHSFGGFEIATRLRCVLAPDYQPAPGQWPDFAAVGERLDCHSWHAWLSGGQGKYDITDWYNAISQNVARLDDKALRDVFKVCQAFAAATNANTVGGAGSLHENAVPMEVSVQEVTRMLQEKQSHLGDDRRQVANLCRYAGIKMDDDMTPPQLQRLLDEYNRGRLRESSFEFQAHLPGVHPRYGETKVTRGSSIDTGLDDLILTLQSFNRGVKTRYVPAQRRLRFARNCLRAHQTYCDRCRVALQGYQGTVLLVTCGHVLCFRCAGQIQAQAEPTCDVAGCDCPCSKSWVEADKLLCTPSPRPEQPSSKVQAVVKLVQKIVGGGERAVIFTPYLRLKDELARALSRTPRTSKDRGRWVHGEEGEVVEVDRIRVRRTDVEGDLGLSEFQAGEGDVLLQSLMSTESAGSNLTIANHVIFAAPLATDATNYQMYMHQSLGRCHRPGQTRDVRVYHFVTAYTLDVDLLELRRGIVLAPLAAPGTDEVLLPARKRPFVRDDEEDEAGGAAGTHGGNGGGEGGEGVGAERGSGDGGQEQGPDDLAPRQQPGTKPDHLGSMFDEREVAYLLQGLGEGE